MYAWLKGIVLAALRVPHEPDPPAGSPDSVRVFRAGRRLYSWNLIVWGIAQFTTAVLALLFFTVMARVALKFPYWLRAGWTVAEALGVLGYLLQLPFTLWLQKLDYEMRWYIVTDRSLRIRSGVLRVQEITMTFANVQKVNVNQGPLQRLLGLSTVSVSSAGGGGGGASNEGGQHSHGDRHAARFEGVTNAPQIRDLILERLRQYRDAGLGDPDDHSPPPKESVPDTAAALDLLESTRGLRLALERKRLT
jgi:membrane protein YdbS with pleckstrin-like domain